MNSARLYLFSVAASTLGVGCAIAGSVGGAALMLALAGLCMTLGERSEGGRP